MEPLKTRLNEVARIAVRLEQETGCPAQLMIAQWEFESAWGAKPVGHANYFGIKKADRHTRYCTVPTREVVHGRSVIESLEFADYDSLADACCDYAWLITKSDTYHSGWARYQQDHDLTSLIAAVARIYATDPCYTRLLLALTTQTNLTSAISRLRSMVVEA